MFSICLDNMVYERAHLCGDRRRVKASSSICGVVQDVNQLADSSPDPWEAKVPPEMFFFSKL